MAPPAAELAIAKASFSAVLFRPEPTSCSRDEIEQFHGLLGETISRCSPTNVQKCKQWALHHLVRSPARAGSLGKYLVALANTYTSEASAQPAKPSPKRRRLHILYILSDIFYHVKQRLGDETFIKTIETHLPALVKSAASFSKCPKHIRKLENLISIWDDNKYFAPHFIKELRRTVEDGPVQSSHAEQNSAGATQTSGSNSKARDAPFIMPSMHGDATTPWYDLPAGNWLPVIEPNSTRPMNPSMIRPLQLASGPPEKTLVDAVKKLLVDVDKIYAKDVGLDGDTSVDIGQTGEFIERDEINGDIISGDTYYGWSRAFCQKMKARRKGGPDEPRGRASSRSRSQSLSRSPSRDRSSSRGPRPAFKRRRLSSTSRSPSGSARREKYRDMSRSPSRSRSRSRQRSYSRPGFQRSSRSYSRSRSPPPRRNFGRELDSGPPSGSPHYSPPPSMPPSYSNNGHFNQPPPPPPPNMPPIPPPQPNYGGWNVPPPPPPPGGYQGQWPPPPPAGGPPQQNWFPPNSHQWVGGWSGVPPPPPPPPPISQQQGGYHYGRGGGGGYRGARGGYNSRGRGW